MITGAIGFQGQYKDTSWFARLVKFFTNSRWSHSFVVISETDILEANQLVERNPLTRYGNDPNCYYELYKINGVTDEQVSAAIKDVITQYEGETYGYAQVLYFVYRWANRILGRTSTPEANIFPFGVICSELVFDYESQLSGAFNALAKQYGFTPDTVSPEDLYRIVLDHPGTFTLIERK